MRCRWNHIHKTFHRTDGIVQTPRSRWKSQQTASGVLFTSLQVSLVGEIYDNSQYDFRHNFDLLQSTEARSILAHIRDLVSQLSAVIIPLEYGVTPEEKAFIGSTFLHPLIRKLRFDFRLVANLPLGDEEIFLAKQDERTASQSGGPRARFYFAHHSHIYAFVSILESVDSIFPANIFQTNLDGLRSIPAYGYLCELIVTVSKHRRSDSWKLTFDVFPGDSFADRSGELSFEPIRVVSGVCSSANEIDDIFSAILAIPAKSGNAPSHLRRLPTIGEQSRDSLLDDVSGEG
jgi:hypothetical protein